MIVQKRYRESVSPDPAVESGLLAMVEGAWPWVRAYKCRRGWFSSQREYNIFQ